LRTMRKGDSADLKMPSGAEPGVTGNRGNEERTGRSICRRMGTNTRMQSSSRAICAALSNQSQTNFSFRQPQPVPYPVPMGSCLFMDTTFLPGTVTFQLAGHEIELLPRVLIIDRQEHPWVSGSTITLHPEPVVPAVGHR